MARKRFGPASWRIARGSGLLLAYLCLVVWLTWPLARQLSTHLPDTHPACRFDTLLMGWVLAHETHALATDPLSVADAHIYYPAPRTLFYGMAAFGALPYFAPAYLLTGNPTLALNLIFLFGVAATAWTLHLTVLAWSGSHLGGFLAAATFLTNRWVLWEWIPTSPGFAILQYFPLIVLLASRRSLRLGGALALFALVVAQSLTELVYVASAVFVPLGILAVARLARSDMRTAGFRLLGVLAAAALVLLPVYAGYIGVLGQEPHLTRQTHWRGPHPMTELPWGLLARGATAIQPAAVVLIAAGLLSLALGGWRTLAAEHRTAWRHAAFWAATGTILSLSPIAIWAGTELRTPTYWLVHLVPGYEVIRLPGRLGVAGLIALALAAGLAFVEIARRAVRVGTFRVPPLLARAMVAALFAVLMFREYDRGSIAIAKQAPLPAAYPLAAAPSPAARLVDALRASGGPVLELPVDWSEVFAVVRPEVGGGVPAFHVQAQYRSIFHGQPVLNGYHSYWPAGFPERMAIAQRLPDPTALDALRNETGLAMILVHTASLHRARAAVWLAGASDGLPGLALVAREGDDLLFRVHAAPSAVAR